MLYTKLLSIFLILGSHTALGLPELLTKQSINNIRYISKKGNITYYQNTTGSLKYSSNYKVKEVKKSPENTLYLVRASENETMIAVERRTRPHNKLYFPVRNSLYIGKFTGDKITKIARGANIQFHNQDNFISFFDTEKKEINILKTNDLKKPKKIKIISQNNPLFIPQVFMATPNDIIYTDINRKGFAAILLYSFPLKKFETIYKSKSAGNKLEVCFQDNHLIIGDFAKEGLEKSSLIARVNLYNNKDYIKSELLYSSPITDLGNMICSPEKLYFIKTISFNEKLNSQETDIAKLELKTKKLEVVTKNGDMTQIIKVGSYILAPHRGKFLIVEGNKSLIDDSIKKVTP